MNHKYARWIFIILSLSFILKFYADKNFWRSIQDFPALNTWSLPLFCIIILHNTFNWFFECLNCDYFTSRKSNYDKHLTTSKHNLLTNVNTNATKSSKNEFNCLKCNKKYKSRVGLWKHKNKCYPDEPSDKQLLQ